ncbi:hydantoinase B/oxoprolinase family protein [Halioxenophilus sp. WMMB6]|uniref:hydantoinase B/oxoprolinase family protein n=1 Tax=Halioxenophilus sp. WMMB6 TaxID=3073815 RepID=UPI00295EF84F|nr:hydantoinase B/oxoprolinase family protein [Halioxenophilus sp. WMMB6]
MNAVDLAIFANRINNLCEEMGAVLQRAAFSPNIKDRLDYSCALFDASGRIVAQAAHIPVHLGSMAFAMVDLVASQQWREGDMVVVNDPFLGGTHLPDVTVIAPIFWQQAIIGFVANRAHHVNIGASTPGSMPISSHLEQEGRVIAPTRLVAAGSIDQGVFTQLAGESPGARGDFLAQVSANNLGRQRLLELLAGSSAEAYRAAIAELHDYGRRLTETELAQLQPGRYHFRDLMDDDGQGNGPIPIEVTLTIGDGRLVADFHGTSKQVAGNINCPLTVTAAAVFYALRCLLPDYTPACAGVFDPVTLLAPEGCLVNARRPAAVAAGNVETSMRLVDVVLGALAQALPTEIPAASQGTMNNIAMGSAGDESQARWDYYETIAGGTGAGALAPGLQCVQSHMTNTLNTPIESLESHFPLRIRRYQRRRGSGGSGRHRGGDGLIREFEFLAAAQVTLLTERRQHSPWGLVGGGAGLAGANFLNEQPLPGKIHLHVAAGDRLRVETPGGGGWGVEAGGDVAESGRDSAAGLSAAD